MKIILSRKGFDASYGGVPSPILPGGRLISLPIPSKTLPRLRYTELCSPDGRLIGQIVKDLAPTKFEAKYGKYMHLDPDIRPNLRQRPSGWQCLFGQAGAARGQLINEEVGENDLFLFFGWFRQVYLSNGHYRYVKDAPNLHVLFGWLQIGQVYDLSDSKGLPRWAKDFPHFGERSGTIVYVARKELNLEGVQNVPGAGVFEQFRRELQLTKDGETKRSIWLLPRWFYPTPGRKPLSCHRNIERWEMVNDAAILKSVAKGQEFVLDAADYPEANFWLKTLFPTNLDGNDRHLEAVALASR